MIIGSTGEEVNVTGMKKINNYVASPSITWNNPYAKLKITKNVGGFFTDDEIRVRSFASIFHLRCNVCLLSMFTMVGPLSLSR